jgi:3-hydroxyisobutyrate dehydrogenase
MATAPTFKLSSVRELRIGVAGLGKMGSAMAARLVDSGCEVIGWNRDVSRVQASGLDYANSPRALAQACKVVITSLFDDDALRAVYCGPNGLVECADQTLFIEMSTASPETQRALSRAITGAGGQYVECPVSGTVAPARSGQLLGFAGGEPDDVEAACAILAYLCKRVVSVGRIGNGARTKLAVNLPLIAFWQAFGEAMALMREVTHDPDWLLDLFSNTAGAPAVLSVKAEALRATLAGCNSVEPAFDIDAMRKDMRLTVAEGSAESIPLPLGEAVLSALDEVAAAGWGRRDCAWVPAFWAEKASSVKLPETGPYEHR